MTDEMPVIVARIFKVNEHQAWIHRIECTQGIVALLVPIFMLFIRRGLDSDVAGTCFWQQNVPFLQIVVTESNCAFAVHY